MTFSECFFVFDIAWLITALADVIKAPCNLIHTLSLSFAYPWRQRLSRWTLYCFVQCCLNCNCQYTQLRELCPGLSLFWRCCRQLAPALWLSDCRQGTTTPSVRPRLVRAVSVFLDDQGPMTELPSSLSRLTRTACKPSWHLYTLQQPPSFIMFLLPHAGGTAAAAPPSFRPGNPSLCGSRPLVTPYYCRLGDLLCFVFMSAYCMFDLSVYYLFLRYFDTVGWVLWPVKTVSHITYTVLAGRKTLLNPIQSVQAPGAGSTSWPNGMKGPLNQALVSFRLVCAYVTHIHAFRVIVILWVLCTSQEVGCEDRLQNDL